MTTTKPKQTLEEKKCNICRIIKPISEFGIKRLLKSGINSMCKQCDREKHKESYKYTKGKHNDRQVEKKKIYYQTHKEQFNEWIKNNQKRNPIKYKARVLFRNAVSRGKITREPCVVCGEIKSEGHHVDYSFPFYVVWLCRKHHAEYETADKYAKPIRDLIQRQALEDIISGKEKI